MLARFSSCRVAALALSSSLSACSQTPSNMPTAGAPPVAPLVVDLRGPQISVAGRPVPDEPRALQRALFSFYQGAPTLELRGHVGDDEQTLRDVLREAAHGPSPTVRVLLTELQLDLKSRLRFGLPRGLLISAYSSGSALQVHVGEKSLGRLEPGDDASEASIAAGIQAACATTACNASLSLGNTTPLVSTLTAWKRVTGRIATTLTISSRAPAVAASSQVSPGALPDRVIQHTVRDHFGSFRPCYVSGLRRDPKLMGDIVVRFVIGPDGNVTHAENDGGNMPDDYVVSCVLRAFEKIRFPKPETGTVTVVYPIAFTPER